MAAARRGFLKAVATLPLAPAAMTAAPLAAPPTVASAAAAPASGSLTSVAEALGEAVRLEHPEQLDASALAEVKSQIARALERAARLRAAARLSNADAPVTTFSPLPPSESERGA